MQAGGFSRLSLREEQRERHSYFGARPLDADGARSARRKIHPASLVGTAGQGRLSEIRGAGRARSGGRRACENRSAFFGHFPKLEVVSNFGVGYDSVDAKYAGQHKIVVTNTPDVLTEEVADTCLGLVLMTVKEMPQSEQWLRAGHWANKGAYPLTHTTLRGQKVGIFGLGRIGKAIAKRLEAFGVEIAYHNRRKVADVSYPYYNSLQELAAAVTMLISVAPGGPETHHIINADVFKALGPKGNLHQYRSRLRCR